ncbi:MAG: 1-hydroxycarotenoid 3,4-desaturase CrtD [Pseudomonadota bacterium]
MSSATPFRSPDLRGARKRDAGAARSVADLPVIVIGAGIGGLAAAIRMAAAGLPVLLLEQHGWLGGKMRSLPSPAGPVDAGPTVMTMRHVFDALFEAAGERLEDHVTLTPDRILARHWWPDGATLDLSADAAQNAAALRAFGGAAAEAEFRCFCARTRHLFERFDLPVMRSPKISLGGLARAIAASPLTTLRAMAPGKTLAALLQESFSDPRLRQLFGRYATYVGGSPFGAPGLLALIWEAELRGVWSVAGGMQALAQALAGLVGRMGVRVELDTEVTGIETEAGRAAWVQLADGSRLQGRAVVFNGDPRALRTGRLGPAMCRAVRASGTEPRALSAWVWSFAAELRGARSRQDPSEPSLVHHNVFFGADPRAEFAPIRAGRLPEDPTLYVCAQDRGGESAPADATGAGPAFQIGRAGPERFEIIMNGAPRGAQVTPEEAQACRTLTFQTLERMGLRFASKPDLTTLTTPADFARMFPASRGSLYGRSPEGMMASFLRPTTRTRIPGLYLAGGGVHPGPGIPMAALSGSHAAAAIATDLGLTSPSRPTAMPGGMSTASTGTAAVPSR